MPPAALTDPFDAAALANALLAPVAAAARIQMSYFRAAAAVITKADRTPVTAADQESEIVLINALRILAPSIPVIAEESMAAGHMPRIGNAFFLVDPLDGTREFIANRPEFTINIALVRHNHPVFGLIYAPAIGEFFATVGPNHAVAARVPVDSSLPSRVVDLGTTRLSARRPPAEGWVVATSHSHMNAATEAILKPLHVAARTPMGSSIKFCRIAEGRADIYPRVGTTCEWDTAAGQAILEAAGGSVTDLAGNPLTYGHHATAYKNPAYIAWGRGAGKSSEGA